MPKGSGPSASVYVESGPAATGVLGLGARGRDAVTFVETGYTGFGDDFNRANESPLSTGWSGPLILGRDVPYLTSNQLAPGPFVASNTKNAWITGKRFTFPDVRATIAARGESGTGWLDIYACFTNPGSAGAWWAYSGEIGWDSTTDSWLILEIGGTGSSITTSNILANGSMPFQIAATDQFRIVRSGTLASTTLTVYVKRVSNGEGSWTRVGSWSGTPRSELQAAGYVGVELSISNGTTRVDDFLVYETLPSLVGSGFLSHEYTKAGAGIAGYPGLTHGTTYTKAGFAVSGTVGSGSSQKVGANVNTKSGYAKSGGVGSGPDQDLPAESGYAAAGLVGSGPGASVYGKSGNGRVGSGLSAGDDFNRANEDPLAGSWANTRPDLSEHLILDTNQVRASGSSGAAISYWTPATFDNVEVEAAVPVLPAGDGEAAYLNARVTSPGSSSWNGYEFGLYAFSGVYNFSLARVANGSTAASLADTTSFSGTGLPLGPFAVSAGDRIKLVCVGTSLQGWHYHAGAWNLRISVTNSVLTSGYVGMEIQGSTAVRVDDFVVTANGLIGSGSSASVFVESGYGAAGTVAAGPSSSDEYSSGRGIAGTVGAGTSASVFVESGYGAAGGVGAGSSASEEFSAGAGIVGTVGAGPSASAFAEPGAGLAGTTAAGSSTSLTAETGYGTVGGTAAGFLARAGEQIKTGRAAAGLVGAGDGEASFAELGPAIAAGVASGSRAVEHTRSGYGAAGTVGSGADQQLSTDTGYGIAGTVGTGARVGGTTVSGEVPVIGGNQRFPLFGPPVRPPGRRPIIVRGSATLRAATHLEANGTITRHGAAALGASPFLTATGRVNARTGARLAVTHELEHAAVTIDAELAELVRETLLLCEA